MTHLKNTDRHYFINRVLHDAFDPRFLDLNKEIRANLTASIKTSHPVFFDLLAKEEMRKYVATTRLRKYYFYSSQRDMNCQMIKPVDYSKEFDYQTHFQSHQPSRNLQNIGDVDQIMPALAGDAFQPEPALIQKYLTIHEDLAAAKQKVTSLINSYRSREKFEKDFPDLAAFLPAVPVKIAMPAIIIADVMADLAAVGIPARKAL